MTCKICGHESRLWYDHLYDDRHGYPGFFKIYKCERCGFGQTQPPLSIRSLAHIYGQYYPRQNFNINDLKAYQKTPINSGVVWREGLGINCQFAVKPGAKVLDIGSGLGYSLIDLEKMGCRAYGLDPDPNSKLAAKRLGLSFFQGTIEDNPYPGQKFDYIIGSQMLEHVANPEKLLSWCKNRINPGGGLIFSFPNSDALTRKIFGRNWLHWHVPYHINHFSKKSIYELANKTGWKVTSLKTMTPNMWMNLQIRRMFTRPNPGERDIFWDGKKGRSQNGITNIMQKLFNLLEEYNFGDRIVDFFGYGDSFVVKYEL